MKRANFVALWPQENREYPLFARPYRVRDKFSHSLGTQSGTLGSRRLRGGPSPGSSIESDPELNPGPLGEQENREAAIAKVAALDHYEAAPLSRRKFAIRD
jgi:hypothetical protein